MDLEKAKAGVDYVWARIDGILQYALYLQLPLLDYELGSLNWSSSRL